VRCVVDETVAPGRSPVAAALGPRADTLPPVFRRQFLADPASPAAIALEGEMARIWYRPRWLKPLLALMGAFRVAVPEMGVDIPARVVIRRSPGPGDVDVHTWRRSFRFRRTVRFPSRLTYDPGRAELVEWLGQPTLFGIVWVLRVGPHGRLTMRTDRYRLSLAGRSAVVPRALSRWLLPAVEFQQSPAARSTDSFVMRARVVHPWLGPVFGYEGRFRLRPTEADRPT